MPDRGPESAGLTRREFLRRTLAVPLGVTAGGLLEQGRLLDAAIAEHTPVTANLPEATIALRGIPEATTVAQKCNRPAKTECIKSEFHNAKQVVNYGVISPIATEGINRAVPSAFLDISFRRSNESEGDAERNLVWGNTRDGTLLTQREVMVGGIFVAIDTLNNISAPHTFPVSGIIKSSILWYLQRRFGFFANTATAITGALLSLQALPKRYGR